MCGLAARGGSPLVSCWRYDVSLRVDRHAGREPLQVIEDYALPRLDAGENNAAAIDLRAELNGTVFGLVAVADDKDEAFALIVSDRAFRNEKCVVECAISHAYRDEHSRDQATVLVFEAGTGADCARAGVDPVVEALNMTAIDVPAVAADHDFHGDLLLVFWVPWP